jgi:hypothetical protein
LWREGLFCSTSSLNGTCNISERVAKWATTD